MSKLNALILLLLAFPLLLSAQTPEMVKDIQPGILGSMSNSLCDLYDFVA